MASALAPRSPRGEQTRLRILAAASSLFAQRGMRGVSMRDLAAAAEISQPGLLRHFSTKDEVLVAVLAHYGDDEMELARLGGATDGFASTEGEREALLTIVAGEGAATGHPAHEIMRARYASDVERLRIALIASARRGGFGAGRDPGAAARELIAGRDGLRIINAYLGDRIDVGGELRARRESMRSAYASDDMGSAPGHPRVEPVAFEFAPSREPEQQGVVGYAVGRARRAQILSEAISVFARDGYADASMRQLAEEVGIAKSALFHHFPTKEDLLQAVLLERDSRIVADVVQRSFATARDALLSISDGVRQNSASSRGLVELYSVLSCEAIPRDHAAHAYFADRYASSLETFTAVFRGAAEDGDLPLSRDPEREALWLVALWDGLQIQWLYDPSVDVAADLSMYLNDVLPLR